MGDASDRFLIFFSFSLFLLVLFLLWTRLSRVVCASTILSNEADSLTFQDTLAAQAGLYLFCISIRAWHLQLAAVAFLSNEVDSFLFEDTLTAQTAVSSLQ